MSKDTKIEVRHGSFIEKPKCKICGANLTHQWLDGDYTLLMCEKDECWDKLHKRKEVSEECVDDEFSKVAQEVEKEWKMAGFSGTIYEEYARSIYNKMINKINGIIRRNA